MTDLYSKAKFILSANAFSESKVYAIKPTDGSGDRSFTRATSGSRITSNGTIAFVKSNVPRLNYLTTSSAPGLLFERAKTNILTYSNTFNGADWSANETSVTSSAIISPDGTLNGWKLNETTANNTHTRIQSSVSVVSGVRYIISAYVKPSERTQCAIQSNLNGGYLYTKFNLTGTGSIYFTPTGYTGSITQVSGGWYRISTSAIADSTTGKYFSFDLVSGSTYTETYAGTSNTTGIYIYGAQIESGSYATSYIPTTTATVTRNAELGLSLPTSSDAHNFTILHIGTFGATETGATPSLQLTSGSNDVYIGFLGTSGQASWKTGSIGNTGTNVTSGSEHKMLLRFENNSLATWFVDGTKIHSQSISIANPSWGQFVLNGSSQFLDSTNEAPAQYRAVILYESALSDTECIYLTQSGSGTV